MSNDPKDNGVDIENLYKSYKKVKDIEIDVEKLYETYIHSNEKETKECNVCPPNKVTVRWFDGYLEEFECSEVRFGAYILWMRLTDKRERIIPLTQVRWFSQTVESHQKKG